MRRGRAEPSIDWNANLDEAARRRCGDGGDYVGNMHPQDRPFRIPEHDDGNRAARQMLLVTHVLVRGDQHVKAGGFCSDQQRPDTGAQDCARRTR